MMPDEERLYPSAGPVSINKLTGSAETKSTKVCNICEDPKESGFLLRRTDFFATFGSNA